MANAERIRYVIANLEKNPEQLDMTTWGRKTECGTAMCLAGWTVELYSQFFQVWWKIPASSTLMLQGVQSPERGSNEYTGVSEHAAKLLGLTGDQANLFYFSNSDHPDGTPEFLADLKAEITRVTGVTFD